MCELSWLRKFDEISSRHKDKSPRLFRCKFSFPMISRGEIKFNYAKRYKRIESRECDGIDDKIKKKTKNMKWNKRWREWMRLEKEEAHHLDNDEFWPKILKRSK